jgi:hypothetical protein
MARGSGPRAFLRGIVYFVPPAQPKITTSYRSSPEAFLRDFRLFRTIAIAHPWLNEINELNEKSPATELRLPEGTKLTISRRKATRADSRIKMKTRFYEIRGKAFQPESCFTSNLRKSRPETNKGHSPPSNYREWRDLLRTSVSNASNNQSANPANRQNSTNTTHTQHECVPKSRRR